MKQFENSFSVSGYIVKDAEIREFKTASVARFSLAVSRCDKTGETPEYTSSFTPSIEAWRKNENTSSYDILTKGTLLTVKGYFKPESWTDKATGQEKNRLVLVATEFYPIAQKEAAPEKKEKKPRKKTVKS